jgi:hypothetical protein
MSDITTSPRHPFLSKIPKVSFIRCEERDISIIPRSAVPEHLYINIPTTTAARFRAYQSVPPPERVPVRISRVCSFPFLETTALLFLSALYWDNRTANINRTVVQGMQGCWSLVPYTEMTSCH